MTITVREAPVGAGPVVRAHRARLVRRVALAALLIAGLLAGSATPAAAHNALLESRPDDGDRLERGPDEVTLRFNADAQEGYGTVVVTGPAGGQWQDGEPRVSAATVTQPLRPLGPAGTYDVSWRIISADGHPVSGTFGFTVRNEGTGTPLPPSEAAGSTDDGVGWWWLTVGLVVGALVLAGVVLIVVTKLPRPGRKRRSAS